MKTDWEYVKALLPKGFLGVETIKGVVIAGPIEAIEIDEKKNEVGIKVSWVIRSDMNLEIHEQDTPWKRYTDNPVTILRFPSDTPYEIDYINELQFRIIFSDLKTKLTRVLYIDYCEMIDMTKLSALKECAPLP